MADPVSRDDPVEAAMAAVRRAPGDPRPWLALGEALYDAGRMAEAARALERCAALAPGEATVLAYQGLAAQALGDAEGAIGFFSGALARNPGDLSSRHNLASALRAADRLDQAIDQVDMAIRSGANMPETSTLRAHLLAETGRNAEAVEQYRAVLAASPVFLDAHETLARLLPQIGRASEALDAYRTALRQAPHHAQLWHSALAAAYDLRDHAALSEFAGQAEAALGDRFAFAAHRAAALGMRGEHAAARDLLARLVAERPDDAGLRTQLSHTLLCLHEPGAAEAHALAASRIAPHAQTAWSHLTVIWRLLGDAREHWLADYDRLVMPIAVDLPDGIAPDLERLHVQSHHPAEQSLRGGTQTRGYLFAKQAASIRLLGERILAAVADRLADLPGDTSHPFLSRNCGDARFTAAWSVRLASEGFHISHIHPKGWLSSALYVALPESIDREHGALAFGIPDAAFGLDLPPRRIEIPEPGKLVVFPSYLWHGTLPFTGARARLTVAFDAIPATEI